MAGARSGIPVLPRELERDVGPAYPDAALQAYVDRVGQTLIARSGVPGSYRFVVLDQPLANAHAAGEWYDDGPTGDKGPQWALLLVAALAGMPRSVTP